MRKFIFFFLILTNCSMLNLIKPRLPAPHKVRGGVKFQFYAPYAKFVTLAGDFNGWGGTAQGRYNPKIDRMHDDGKNGDDTANDGVWTIVISLSPGTYQYKFVIDGINWYTDPNNPETIQSGGFTNSVVRVK